MNSIATDSKEVNPTDSSLWATWSYSSNGYTATLTANSDLLDDPINELTPDQNITELKISETGGGGVNFQVVSPGSSLTAVSGTGTYGGTATLTATLLSAAGTPLADKPVTFDLMEGGTPTPVGSAMTNASGVATLTGVSLAGLPADIPPDAVMAVFAGDPTDSPTTAYGNLTGNIAITNALVVNGSDNPLTMVTAGEWVYIQADFTTAESAEQRLVPRRVHGQWPDPGHRLPHLGCRRSRGRVLGTLYWGTFLATPGTNQVTVTVDPDQSVAETSLRRQHHELHLQCGVARGGNLLSYTVAQIRAAYGINSIPNFGSATADGSGQTIALVEAGNEPTILTDLDGFDQAMSLTTRLEPRRCTNSTGRRRPS